MLIKEFDSLKHTMFDELCFEILPNDMAIDENKAVIEKILTNLESGKICGKNLKMCKFQNGM